MGARDTARGADAVASIVAENASCADKIEVVQCDVTDAASVSGAAATVKASLGSVPLYGLVNNAGAGLAHGVSAKQIVETNLYGAKRVGDAFVPLLSTEGRVVNVGSGIGPGWMSRAAPEVKSMLVSPQVTWEQVDSIAQTDLASGGQGENAGRGPEFNAYGMTKAALMAYTHILVARHPNITSSTCSPGFIDTAMTKGFNAKLTPEQGTVSIRHCLFSQLGGNGWMWGSDAKRSPIDASREPGEPEYTDPSGRGY